jgi:hypothetical protein
MATPTKTGIPFLANLAAGVYNKHPRFGAIDFGIDFGIVGIHSWGSTQRLPFEEFSESESVVTFARYKQAVVGGDAGTSDIILR